MNARQTIPLVITWQGSFARSPILHAMQNNMYGWHRPVRQVDPEEEEVQDEAPSGGDGGEPMPGGH
jgi:hypothetical protein